VLFADVVGATALSGRLDPEALRALLLAYQQVCVECTGRYGGNIHQYAGDGVLAYFGYPVAHDNDAERAVLTGLDIVEGMQRLAAGLRQRGEEEVWVRVGVHTGVVVVGEMGAGDVREVHAIGETPNVAARIQGEAAPGSVCISAATLRLLKPRFQTRSMGNRLLKGMAKEIELFAVDAVFADAIADGAIPRHTMPLIGRERELAHLQERWALARNAQGQAVLDFGRGRHRQVASARGFSRTHRPRRIDLAKPLLLALLSEQRLASDGRSDRARHRASWRRLVGRTIRRPTARARWRRAGGRHDLRAGRLPRRRRRGT
jgi:class 3 adenylate cyclase